MFDDQGHLPNQRFPNEIPQTRTYRGPEGIKVELVEWGPKERLWERLWAALQTTWGEGPVAIPEKLNSAQMAYVEKGLAGRTLGHNFEFITFSFQISGIARACTHQIVRTRLGTGGTQQGGRDNDWRHHSFNIPETVWRICQEHRAQLNLKELPSSSPNRTLGGDSLLSSLNNPTPIVSLMEDSTLPLDNLLSEYLGMGKTIYAALVDAGVPWQDARRYLPIGLTTHLFWNWNLPSLIGWCSNRLEFIMDWEINCVAQLMRREIYRKCPVEIFDLVMSHSERAEKAMFADMDLWPPDGQWLASREQETRDRMHYPTQNPYWVLHPGCYNSPEPEWIPSNGKHPLPGFSANFWAKNYMNQDEGAEEGNGN